MDDKRLNDTDTPYQVLPPMAPDQFEALKQDIAERGVLTPIDLDEQGHVLDGHNRVRVCNELGITNYPVFVRAGLSEIEKRTYARQVNTLRRHLTRTQLRELIAGQLRDTPGWANARIARALGVSKTTVSAVRRRLESTGQIDRFDRLEGDDGKTRPSRQPVRPIYVENVEDFDWNALGRFIERASVRPDPFAGCTDAEIRDWHLFVLFLVQQCGFSVDGAGIHAEWVRGRFQTVAEWLTDDAATWRRSVGMHDVPKSTIRAWTVFAAERADRTSPELISELRDLNPALHTMTARHAPRESV
jgi:hypothetical protein